MLFLFNAAPQHSAVHKSAIHKTVIRATIFCAAMTLIQITGCSQLDLPSFDPFFRSAESLSAAAEMPPAGEYPAAQAMPVAATSIAEQVYQSTRQAKNQSGVVLQIVGDETPIRVLPLPDDGRSVYVSQLLSQTGIVKKLGSVEAKLFRYSIESIGGLPMDCKMSKDGQTVKPETDYALQPGDRLRVKKHSKMALDSVVDLVLAR